MTFKLEDLNPGELDVVVFGDSSGSMDLPADSNNPGGQNRWDAASEYFKAILRVALPLDENGVTAYYFAQDFRSQDGLKTPTEILNFLKTCRNRGSTYFGAALQDWANTYLTALRQGAVKKHTLCLCVTDGETHDTGVVEATVRKLANAIGRDDQLAIGVIQVGDDRGASEAYQALDRKIKGESGGFWGSKSTCKFDIFDVKTPDELDDFDSIGAMIEDFFNESHESN
jgi:hypothetical protein